MADPQAEMRDVRIVIFTKNPPLPSSIILIGVFGQQGSLHLVRANRHEERLGKEIYHGCKEQSATIFPRIRHLQFI